MMKLFISAACLLATASAAAVTPVEKVITLLEDLKTGIETEGAAEASTYDKFACFCKDTTMSKSDAITAGRDNIDLLSATIAEKTAAKEEKEAELMQRKQDQEAMAKELKATEVQYAKEKAEYEANAADLSKAISSLESAVKVMEGSKPTALLAVRASVEQSLRLADALGLIADTKRGAVSAFLQTGSGVDPSDPMYKYHSQGIVETLTTLLQDFTGQKKELDDEWAVSAKTFKDTISSLGKKLDENSAAMDTLKEDIETLKGEIAESREKLVNAEGMLKDDQLYMKDLTERCETRAKDWDQRSALRNDELTALTGALDILTSKASGLDTSVNKRALFLEKNASGITNASHSAQVVAPKQEQPSLKTVAKHAPSAGGGAPVAAVAFVQEALARRSAGGRSAALLRGTSALTSQALHDKVVSVLKKEGQRLGSSALSQLAAHLAADPFLKVKTLIQQLVERLIAEATNEATKKGFCDTELGKANQDRTYRLADTRKLDVEVQAFEIQLIELKEEIELLTSEVDTLRKNLKETTELRATEKEENLDTMKQAKEGFAAVSEALNILKVFYKQSAKATVLAQASPVDEDTTGAGFSGAYKGKQESSKGIIGMLEVIKSDFDRTDTSTEAAEKRAHEEFVEFDRTSKTDISGKETRIQLDTEDVLTTENTIVQKMEDLKTAQELLDGALKRIEDLTPTCVDTGMSFEARVAKREEEVVALKNALCILDAEGVEADCQGQ